VFGTGRKIFAEHHAGLRPWIGELH
jgi:hypothetical protein